MIHWFYKPGCAMSGIKFLLDTNFILGLLKSQPVVLDEVALRKLSISECGYSAVARRQLLGFPGISLRQTRKVKLPDAIIAATALCAGIELLTLDKHLQSVVQIKEN